MAIGIVGRKRGMTRVFTDTGESIPVTVVEATPNRVTQIKAKESDGYSAVQVTVGERRPNRVNRAIAGHVAKAGVEMGRGLWEFRLESGADAGVESGGALTVEQFEAGAFVDVTGTSKGKGFAGTVKRHNFQTQDNSHGNSASHRAPGSIGQAQDPGRVFPGKKMSGQMGNVRETTQNLEVIRVDVERNLLLVRGAIPGPANADVIVRPAVKQLAAAGGN
ncbi:50S ribosomal protein L3 [Spiribacter vilamensis]|uniref:Large ribosomal subunit protein uL3 n=1 Tax=Spiribacter vilamensis TaxID=531306 RepID=A0A4Q8CXW8_9GAMM|nr:50S ribosomal protein L3 [Spiribacter vilamensis]RZU97774.1 LSU ribosomal protein L3P [Spiribacter vilamensis]TVO61299.1 50S ribosomal protein L3 [Spiribacter vilamensis]